jgi:hypothetical protein
VRAITLRVLVVLSALTLAATAASAQRRGAARRAAVAAAVERPSFGAHLGYNFDADDILLGAQLTYPITPRLALYPSFDYYFQSGATLWALNGDIKFHPPTPHGYFYFGGGLNILHGSAGGVSSTDTHLNLLGGLEGRRWRSTVPYLEAKLMVGNGSAFQIVGGLSWH